jgi:hypothetical protein
MSVRTSDVAVAVRGDGLRIAQPLAEPSQASVVGAEVVSPFADAMRLVHRQQLDPRAADRVQKPLVPQPLGRHVDQIEFASGQLLQAGLLFGQRQRTVDARGADAQRGQAVDLVLHQGDQRRDDQRDALAGDRGQLVAETLAPAGRHDAQAVVAGQHGGNHFALPFAERGQFEASEIAIQIQLGGFGHPLQRPVRGLVSGFRPHTRRATGRHYTARTPSVQVRSHFHETFQQFRLFLHFAQRSQLFLDVGPIQHSGLPQQNASQRRPVLGTVRKGLEHYQVLRRASLENEIRSENKGGRAFDHFLFVLKPRQGNIDGHSVGSPD